MVAKSGVGNGVSGYMDAQIEGGEDTVGAGVDGS